VTAIVRVRGDDSPSGEKLRSVVRNPWTSFLARRLLGFIGIVVALVFATFLMVQLVPGDPVVNSLGPDTPLARVVEIRHQYGLDRPLLEQFTTYVGRLLHGDLGRNFLSQQPVTDLIKQRLGTSAQLAGTALLFVLLVGVAIGMLAAALTNEGRHRRLEVVFTGTTSVLGAVPEYLMATILAFLFAVELRLLPVAGSGSLSTLVLPALAVSVHGTATLSRIVRVETLNVLAQDYIRTARSDRLPWWTVYMRHALPNVLTAALALAGLIFASVLGGAIVVENVFARAGLGTSIVNAVIAKDYPTVQGITLVFGIAIVTINTLIDIAIALLDPRSLARHA
jgi:peptide/nickel transport system permease protein